jgi:hypothetical protein
MLIAAVPAPAVVPSEACSQGEHGVNGQRRERGVMEGKIGLRARSGRNRGNLLTEDKKRNE